MIPSIELIPSKRKCRSIASFLNKTFDLLNQQQNSDIVRWSPNGIGFIVINQDRFAQTILPHYFKHSNYSSFVRQLNMYNFHKIRESNTQSYFHHEHFDRDNKNSLSQIKRKPEKKKRKIIGQEDQSQGQHILQTKKTYNKENHNNYSRKSHELIVVSDSNFNSEFDKSNQVIRNKESLENTSTNQLLSSEFTLKFGNFERSESYKRISQNFRSTESIQDDKISINNDISQRLIGFPTKQLMYPSKHNLFPFGAKQAQNFNVFF